MSKIRIRNGPYSGREKTLATEPVTIGRDAEAGVQILDRSASRFHAEVFPVGGMFFVRDLDSKNGTYVNDERLTDEELLREGDVIKIGTTELAFESGIALNDNDSSERIAYHDDADMLSNTLEFKLDDLSDIADEAEEETANEGRSLQILYQVGKLLSQAEHNGFPIKVLDFLIKAMPAESALIFMRDGNSGKLIPHTVRTLSTQTNPVICRTIIRRTVAENRAIFTADAQDDERFNRKESVISQGIRSVVCVPLTIGGQSRGVLYVSRNVADGKFDKTDMEVVSATAIQLGLAFHTRQRDDKHRKEMLSSLAATVRAVENHHGASGIGERAAKAARALALGLKISSHTIEVLELACHLHHLPELLDKTGNDEEVWSVYEDIAAMDEALALARTAKERIDGSGPLGLGDEQLDTEQRLIAITTAFANAVHHNPDADSTTIIDNLEDDPGIDPELVTRMRAAHYDGSLYRGTAPPTSAPETASTVKANGTEELA